MSVGLSGAFVLEPGEGRGSTDGVWSMRLTGADTRGQSTVGQADMGPMSSGPSLHIHSREDEICVVIEGVLTVQLGDELFEVPAGGIAFLARGVPHTFANLTAARVRVLGFITPAGLEGMFEETGEYIRSLSGPPDPERIAAIADRYGVKSVGPPIEVAPRVV